MDLTDLARAQILSAFYVFLRLGAAMALLPAFGERMVPLRVRLVLTLAFTAIVTPAVAQDAVPSQVLGFALGTEVVIGLALGAILRLFVLGLQIAGSIAAQSVSLAQIFGTQAVDAMPAIGHVITLSGLTIAVIAGLHLKVAEFLILSYELMPLGRFPEPEDLTSWGVARTAQAFGLGFTLAAPFVITSVIYNLALGAINRAMPQLMVAFVGAPAITAGGLILLALALPFMLQIWLSAMDGFFANPSVANR
ncbi:flagellar biosynthetic protein FliR [Palleronia pontilimi]|nr:flagellar biosynthetic protein FliR [Palleronia pontilimi]